MDIHDENDRYLTPEPEFKDISKTRKIMFVLLMASTQLFTQASLAEAIIPYKYVSKTFNVENNGGEISWMSASFALTVGTFILIAGRFGDLLGYKKMYLLSYFNLTIWSILAGISSYSKSVEFFDVCRGMQGLSFAISMPNSLALIGHYFPDGKEKILAFSAFGAVAPGGFFIGALWSSMFVLRTTWEWIYYINGIASFLFIIVGYLIIPNKIGTNHSKITLEMFDPLGSILGVSGLVLINFSFNQGPTVGWEEVYVYVLLIVGFILMGLFVYVQKKTKYPLIPPLNLKVVLTLVCMAAGWSSFGIWLFYQLKFSLEILNQSPIVVSVQFVPAMISGIIAAASVGFLIHKIPISIIMLISMVFFLVGIILNGLRPTYQVYWIQRFLSLILTPFAMDTSFPAGTILLSMALPREHQGVAGSLIATVVNYSIAIGLGLAGTAEYYTIGRDGKSHLQGIRNAFYTGMGLAGLGVVVAIISNVIIYCQYRRSQCVASLDEQEEEKV